MVRPRVIVQTGFGDFAIELDQLEAPALATNFLHLVAHKYYDGLTIHRVVPGFMIQGGCPNGDGTGSPYMLKDMPISEKLRHVGKGIVGMAGRGPGTAGSQFYVTLAPCPHLDSRHAVIGHVVDGLETLEDIGAVETTGLKPKGKTRPNKPLKDVVINSIRQVA